MNRYTDDEKRGIIKQWDSASGNGSTMRRTAIAATYGISRQAMAANVSGWRKRGFGRQPVDALDCGPLLPDTVSAEEWLDAVIGDCVVDDAAGDRLIAHLFRFKRRKP